MQRRDRILKGANPVELPTQFAFIVNQKAARALMLPLSATLPAGADDVIE